MTEEENQNDIFKMMLNCSGMGAVFAAQATSKTIKKKRKKKKHD